MLVGVISDTHDNLPMVEEAISVFKNRRIREVVHLGDWCSPFTLAKLATSGLKVTGIFGNNDGDHSALQRIALSSGMKLHSPPFEMDIDGKKALLVHGYKDTEFTKKIVDSIALGGKYDMVLYGHTHKTDSRMVKDCLVFNPGECLGYLNGTSTVGVLDTSDMHTTIIQLTR